MTTTNQTDAQMKLADVTQADREAAHEFHREMFRRLMDNELSKTLGEEEGDARPIYQAFARHRQATEARAQGLVETLENLLDDGHSYESEGQARDAARQALATWRRT